MDPKLRIEESFQAPPEDTMEAYRLWGLSERSMLVAERALRRSGVKSLDDCNTANLKAARTEKKWVWPW